MITHVYVPSERVNRFLVSDNEVWLNILGEKFTPADAYFVCRQVISGYRVIIINDTKCKYTFNFPKINSACKAGKFVQVGCIIMCICIFNGIMAYQYFLSKSRGWNNILQKDFIVSFIFSWNWFTYPLLYLISIRPYITYPMASLHLKFAVWVLTLQWPSRT